MTAATPGRFWTVNALIFLALAGSTLLAIFVVPPGHEGQEGGPVDHNWGGHVWAHLVAAGILGLGARWHWLHRQAPTARQAWRDNPLAVLAWGALAWGAAAFFIDGTLTALAGDDTSWTHGFALQAALQFPFYLGVPLFGLGAGVWRWRRDAAARPAPA